MILKHARSGKAYVTLGSYTWAALVWNLIVTDDRDDRLVLQLDCQGAAEWFFVTDPDEWTVLEYESYRAPNGILMHQTASPEPLLSYSLTHAASVLTEDDLVQMWGCRRPQPDGYR
eukprot:8158774-Karenia_brevis.AAC.1